MSYARITQPVFVPSVPGFSGLGQTDAIATLAARSAELRSLQTTLMSAGALSLRTADGLISSSDSPTLAAIRNWATMHGLSATGTTRTSDGGLAIPSPLLASIMSAVPSVAGGRAVTTPEAPTSAVLPGSTLTTPSRWPSWLPWAGGGAVAIVAIVAISRRGSVAKNPGKKKRRTRTQRSQDELIRREMERLTWYSNSPARRYEEEQRRRRAARSS